MSRSKTCNKLIQRTHYRTPCHSVSGQFFILPQQAGGYPVQLVHQWLPTPPDGSSQKLLLFKSFISGDKVDTGPGKRKTYSSYSSYSNRSETNRSFDPNKSSSPSSTWSHELALRSAARPAMANLRCPKSQAAGSCCFSPSYKANQGWTRVKTRWRFLTNGVKTVQTPSGFNIHAPQNQHRQHRSKQGIEKHANNTHKKRKKILVRSAMTSPFVVCTIGAIQLSELLVGCTHIWGGYLLMLSSSHWIYRHIKLVGFVHGNMSIGQHLGTRDPLMDSLCSIANCFHKFCWFNLKLLVGSSFTRVLVTSYISMFAWFSSWILVDLGCSAQDFHIVMDLSLLQGGGPRYKLVCKPIYLYRDTHTTTPSQVTYKPTWLSVHGQF